MGLFSAKNGFKIMGPAEIDLLGGSVVPSAGAGVSAPVGSLYLKTDGVSYKKTGSGDTDWQPYSEIEGGGLLWSTISGATTLEASKGYILDSASTDFTVTMPASPEAGDVVGFAGLGDIETNNITVSLNGSNMNGSSDDLIIDLNYCYFEMLYTGDASTGWVLSNTDESGNVDNIQAFIGNDDNADAAVTEFTEENYIAGGDDLETAIDKLDMALADAEATTSGVNSDLSSLESRVTTAEGNISSNDTDIATNAAGIATNASGIAANASDISNLESYTGSNGASAPDYNNEYFITDGDSLEEAISKLDAALNTVDNLAATGVNWRQFIKAATGAVVDTGASAYSGTDHFSDDDQPYWDYSQWQDGDQVLSTNATTSGIIYTWSAAGDQWVQTGALGPNDAVAVRYDFLDNPGSQEDGAAYMMASDSSGVIKIADFDLETAATIGISSGFTVSSGTVTSADSVESAIEKLAGNGASYAADITALDGRVTVNEGDIDTAQADIITNASGIAANAADISNLEAFTGSNGDASPSYTSNNYITDGVDLEASMGALDAALAATDATVSGNTASIADNYTYITNVDTAHDNLAAAVLTEATTSVTGSSSDTVLDTVAQAGNLGAKWFVIAYDGSGNRYAAEIYAMHDGTTTADLTEYAILTIGTKLNISFNVTANGTNMSLTVDNTDASAVTIKTQRITVQTASVNTTAALS